MSLGSLVDFGTFDLEGSEVHDGGGVGSVRL